MDDDENWIPHEGGIAATQKLKSPENLQHIPIISFSANSDIQSLANQAGAESFLAKPFDLEDLDRVINYVM